MAHLLTMPAVVADTEEAVLASWLVNEGDEVMVGQPIAEVETEKATVEMESTGTGRLSKVLVNSGDLVAVGTPIAGLLDPGEHETAIDQLLSESDYRATEKKAQSQPSVEATPEESSYTTQKVSEAGETFRQRTFISPIARKMAKEAGLAFENLIGSGPNGRIIRADVETEIAKHNATQQHAPAPLVPEESNSSASYYEEKPSPMRKAIARRLSESKASVPHFYLTVSVFMDELLRTREEINAQLDGSGLRVTVNDLFLKALAIALHEVPEANATWSNDVIRYYKRVDIAVAIAIENGLITPVLQNVSGRSVSSISKSMNDVKERSQVGKIRQDELEGGSFTLSNLGMFGVRDFSAIINSPQAGIVATGAVEEQVVAIDGEPKVMRIINATLSADHRVVDGSVGARLMQAFKNAIEKPMRLLV